MTAEQTIRATSRVGRVLTAGALVALVASAGCASEADPADVAIGEVEFAATPEFIAAAAERSLGEAYRVETAMSFDVDAEGGSLDMDAPYMSGEYDGDRSSVVIDMTGMFRGMADLAPSGENPLGEFTRGDLQMEMVTDGSTMYLRAPIYAALSEADPGSVPGPLGDLADLGDGWGRVDLERLDAEFGQSDAASVAGGRGVDPSVYLDLVADTDQVRELGGGDVRGADVQGLAADVTMADMLEVEGMDREAFTDAMTSAVPEGSPGEKEMTDLIDAMLDTPMPVEVWVDEAGYVRKLEFELDMQSAFESIAGDDEIDADVFDAFSVGTSMEFFDYGDESIDIEVPDEARDAVDVTDAYLDLLGGASQGA